MSDRQSSMTETPRAEAVLLPFARGRLINNSDTFGVLAKLHHDISASSAPDLIIDMQHVTWFDAHLSAPLKVIVNHAKLAGKNVRMGGAQEKIRVILSKNRLLKTKEIDNFGTTIPVTNFETSDGVNFLIYAKKHLDRREVPKMTDRVKSRFFECIDEIFANSSIHSMSKVPIVASSQFFSKI